MPDWHTLLPGVDLGAASPRAPRAADEEAVPMAARALRDAGIAAFLAAAGHDPVPLTLVVNDAHRFNDTRSFLDALFAIADEGGAAGQPARPRLLVAAGSHRSTAAERAAHEARVLGPWAPRFAAVAWHDAHDPSVLARVGAHELHAWMREGGHYLACGSMEPHYFAGVTGAHKTLTVGVMSLASLTANHEHAMSAHAGGLRLAGNPVHEGIVRAVADLEAAGARLFALNQVIVDGAVVACTAGHPLAALANGLPVVRGAFAHRVPRPLDLVIAEVGPPLDRDLYQADKGIKNTEGAVRDGGVLILEAACERGVGLDQFVALLRVAPTHARALEVVEERGYRLGDHKAVRLRALTDTRGVRLGLIAPGIDAALGDVLGAAILPDRAAAAAWAARHLGGVCAQGLVVEDAGNLTLTTG